MKEQIALIVLLIIIVSAAVVLWLIISNTSSSPSPYEIAMGKMACADPFQWSGKTKDINGMKYYECIVPDGISKRIGMTFQGSDGFSQHFQERKLDSDPMTPDKNSAIMMWNDLGFTDSEISAGNSPCSEESGGGWAFHEDCTLNKERDQVYVHIAPKGQGTLIKIDRDSWKKLGNCSPGGSSKCNKIPSSSVSKTFYSCPIKHTQ
jgi:hypothetical protein